MAKKHLTTLERFESFLDKSGPKQPHMKTRCWLWTGALDHTGYGVFWVNGKKINSHRFVLQHVLGESSLHTLHGCDVRACVRPTHLRYGSPRDNAEDRRTRSVSGRQKLALDDVREIRRRMSQGESPKKLAEVYGIAWSNARAIKNNHSWKGVQ